MSLSKEVKEAIIKEYARNDADTGSTELQVALLSERIRQLTEHLKINKKDFSCKRGLLKLVAQRRKLLQYFKRKDEASYLELIKRLGLKR